MATHTRTKDSQNPYRTGVLNGNHVEDVLIQIMD